MAATQAMERTNRVQGDFPSMGSNPIFDFLAPYNRWPRFVVGNTLKTLPLHYPLQALAMQRLGAYGQQYQNQLGLLSPSLQGLVDLGGPSTKALTAQTSYPLAMATLGGLVQPTGVGESLSGRGIMQYLSPWVRTPLGLMAGQDPVSGHAFKSATGAPVNGLSDFRLDLAQMLDQAPALRTFFQRGAHPSDASVPLPGLNQNVLSAHPSPTAASHIPIPLWMSALNTLTPFRLGYMNLPQQEIHDVMALKTKMVGDLRRAALAQTLSGKSK
jgi:hypothetical protein